MKKNKGITLIALVITIIVLLILAGVTINAIIGNESSMEKAKQAQVENEKGNELDTIKLAVADAMAKSGDGTIHLDKLNESLTGLVKGEATGDSPWIVTGNTGYKYRITSYGEVTLESTVDIVRNNQIVTDKTVTVGTSEVGNTIQLTAEPTPDVTLTSSSWSSSNTSVATIDSSTGLVTIVAEGQTTITLTAVTSIGNISKTCKIKVGDSVAYTTTLNGVTLSDWKVFYVDGDYTYIILADYLPNSAVNITNISKHGDYSVNSYSRVILIDAMTTTSNWSSLLTGTLNGNNIDYRSSTDTNIKAMGSPTLDLYLNSWNSKYPSDQIYTAIRTDFPDSIGWGYYIGDSENPTTYKVRKSNSDILYYPHTSEWNSCDAYWLASPSANQSDTIMYVDFSGYLCHNQNYQNNRAFRPVICLPSSIF